MHPTFLSTVFANLSISLVNSETSKVRTAESLATGQAARLPFSLEH